MQTTPAHAEIGRKECNGKSFLDFKKESSTAEFPEKFAAYAKSFGSIYFWPQGNFHVISDPEIAKLVLSSKDFSADRSQFFISRMPNLDLRLIKDFFSVVQKMMVMSDGREHANRRRAAAVGFEDDILKKFQDKVKNTVATLVADAFAQGSFDFVKLIAIKLPSVVLADLFCIPEQDRLNFYIWSNNMTAFFGGASQYRNEDGVEVNHSASQLRDYFKQLIEERREKLGDDYISQLIRAQKISDLSDDEIASQAIMMLVAGQVTTSDQLSNIMYQFANHQQVRETLSFQSEKIPAALEELKRLDPAVSFLFRIAKKDHNLSGQQINAGEAVFIANHAINRGDTVENPDQLSLQRKINPHFSYGYGPHHCLGAKLARMQLKCLFEEIFRNHPNFSLDHSIPAQRDHYSLSFSGFKHLQIKTQPSTRH